MVIRSLILLLILSILYTDGAYAFDVPEQYRVGITFAGPNSMPPLAFVGPNGEPKGYVVDFWRKWSNETGVPVAFRLGSWSESVKWVQEGETDAHLGMFLTPERATTFEFSERIYPIEVGLFVPRKSLIQEFGDLTDDTTIAVLKGGGNQQWLRRHHPSLNLKEYPTTGELIEAFVAEETEALIADSHVAFHRLGSMGELKRFHLIEVLKQEYFYAVAPKGKTELIDLVNRGMDRIDEYERKQILAVWYVPDSSISDSLKGGLIASVVVLLLGVVLLYFGGRIRLTRK